jgi:hypothetical protein
MPEITIGCKLSSGFVSELFNPCAIRGVAPFQPLVIKQQAVAKFAKRG